MKWDFVIDTREKPKIRQICDVIKIPYVREMMEVGDFGARFRKNYRYAVCIERKSIPDLIGSIQSGRLFPQLKRLYTISPQCALFISGSLDEFVDMMWTQRKLRVNKEVAYGTISSVTVKLAGIMPVLWFQNDVDLLKTAYKVCEKASEGNWGTGIDVKRKWQIRPEDILKKFPGIKKESTAKALLKKGGSLRGVFCLSKEELQAIDGIGPVRAEELYNRFNREC